MTREPAPIDLYKQISHSTSVKMESDVDNPVDLTCKKLLSPSSPASTSSDSEQESCCTLSFRSTSHLEHYEKSNNVDAKSRNCYHNCRKNDKRDDEKVRQNKTDPYPHLHESKNFINTNHERKNLYENVSHMPIRQSDTSSTKKNNFQPIPEKASTIVSEGLDNPYPIIPLSLGLPMVVASMNMPPTIPNLTTSPSSTESFTMEESVKTHAPMEDTKKAPRPFKAYPKDPLSISLVSDVMFDPDQKQAYYDFRNRMLESVKRTNEGTNIKMRRVSKNPMSPTDSLEDIDTKNAMYMERRRKNNEAAKRSRDARRAKEDEIAIRAAFLEKELLRLKYENALLKEENSKLSKLAYGS
ncbi:hepatic leukemia factor-like [Phymastichus coffea]|uniref:hepatic leukemia factor-like n=1 Tax=Phymastichus coffea TaxID=108790 RepID=UPI00273AA16A|nr:hepatic leukemia factor-like [Phymastichus coffea]